MTPLNGKNGGKWGFHLKWKYFFAFLDILDHFEPLKIQLILETFLMSTLMTLEIPSWSQFSHSSDSRHVHLHGGKQSELHQGQHPHPRPDGGHLLRSEGRHSSKLCDISRSTWTRGDSR